MSTTAWTNRRSSRDERSSAALVGAPGHRVDARGYVHPRDEDEIVALVRHARAEGLTVRVRGASHSVPGAIFSDARLGIGERDAIEIELDRLTAVRFDDAQGHVIVQAGCRFGADPGDPTGRATEEAGLCAQLDCRGLAIANLPGVSHATVGGFLATGSAGGSVKYGVHDAVVAIRLVDGTGTVRTFHRDTDPDRFAAAGVSMGLLGVITEVTLKCVPRFDVIGSEQVTAMMGAEVDPFADDGLATLLEDTDYARLLWWAQEGVDKLVVWKARRMAASDYDDRTGPAWAMRPQPYRAFPELLGSQRPMQAAAGLALTGLASWRSRARDILGRLAGPLTKSRTARKVERALIDAFVPEDTAPRPFWDGWSAALPMDDRVDEQLVPTTFFEIWLPIAALGEAMRRLRDRFAEAPHLAGQFAIEIYAAGPSPFWLSPSHGGARARLNVFWLERHPEDARTEALPAMWSLLSDLDPRLHWGKLLPLAMEGVATQLSRSYARRDDFLRARAELDPDGVFLTAYWRAALQLPGPVASEAPPLPAMRRFDAAAAHPRAWPMVFRLEPSGPELLETARFVIDVTQYLPTSPAHAYAVFSDVRTYPRWLNTFVRIDWLTEPFVMAGGVFDETLELVTLRCQVHEDSPGEKWSAAVVASSLPLGTRMFEQLDFTAAADGGTDLRWRVAYDLPAALVPFDGAVSPMFRWVFASSMVRLAQLLDRERPSREASSTAGSLTLEAE